jgi:hypothetical protein
MFIVLATGVVLQDSIYSFCKLVHFTSVNNYGRV